VGDADVYCTTTSTTAMVTCYIVYFYQLISFSIT